MIDKTGPWVCIAFVDGCWFDEIADMSTEEMVEELAQLDSGIDDDYDQRDTAPWGSLDRLYEHRHGGIDYVLSVNWKMGYSGLQRRPLG